ncbi:RBR-type E3 ubiquitin transferase [Ranunculus cassubicifolius]
MSKEENQTPTNTKNRLKPSISDENGENKETLFTPRFRSVAAMAGWDEEALLLASLVVEDTPDRDYKRKKRISPQIKSPPSSLRRIKRVNRRNAIPTVVLDLDDDENVGAEDTKKKESSRNLSKDGVLEGSRKDNTMKAESTKDGINKNTVEDRGKEDSIGQTSSVSSSGSALPCMNRLKEELSCAICLDICYEPSTTSCGHSFCKKCLKSAADKCRKKCPKCRQLISNGRSCTVNTVLWNTIQLLFPQEVESRKAAESAKGCELACRAPEKEIYDVRTRVSRASVGTSREVISERRRRSVPNQSEDAALALRLQREEYLAVARGNQEQTRPSFITAREQFGRSSFSSARENLRAMVSRANIRARRP